MYVAVTPDSIAIPSQASARSSTYRADVDGLRAVAVLAVVVYHAFPNVLPGGFVGVDVFFVISGYLISGIILRELGEDAFTLGRFYARRIRRIFPALALVFCGVAALGWLVLLPDEFQLLGRSIVQGSGFLANLGLYADTNWYFGYSSDPFIHLWSLGIEEQFYLVWPLFLLVLWRLRANLLLGLGMVTLLSFVLNVVTVAFDPVASFYLPWNRLWELSSGGILAAVEVRRRQGGLPALGSSIFGVLAVVGSIFLAVSFLAFDGYLAYPGWWALLPTAGTLLLITAGPQAWLNGRLLSNGVVVFIGLISYPLYLWHWPLLVLARLMEWRGTLASLCAIGTAVVLACVTYKYVELPIRRSSPGRPFVISGLVAAMATSAVLGLLLMSQLVPARAERYDVERYVRAATEDWISPAPGTPEVHRVEWAHWTLFVDGPVRVGASPESVLFVGDSNMQQYYPRIAKVLADNPQNSRGAVFFARSGCAPGAVDALPLTDALLAPCRQTLRSALDYASRQGIDTVVIGANWNFYFSDPSEAGQKRTAAALVQLGATIERLMATGKRVYLVLNIPAGAGLDPRAMIRRAVFAPAFRLEIHSLSRSEVERNVRAVRARLLRIAEQTGAIVIDPIGSLCDVTVCPSVLPDGEPIYRDGGHLRPSYVRDHVRFLDRLVLVDAP